MAPMAFKILWNAVSKVDLWPNKMQLKKPKLLYNFITPQKKSKKKKAIW